MNRFLLLAALLFARVSEAQLINVGTARGLACVHCMAAPSQALEIVDTIHAANILRNITDVMVEGTFGYDESLLLEIARILSDGGRIGTLNLYLLNGPGQRRCGQGWKGLGANVCPHDWERLVQTDINTQRAFIDLTARLIPVAKFLSDRGGIIRLFPCGLEDNLDDVSCSVLIGLSQRAMADTPYILGRNPSEGGRLIHPGVVREVHLTHSTTAPCVMTNDGIDLSPSRQLLLQRRATRNGCDFIVWDRGRQGLTSRKLPPPELRNYKHITTRTRLHLINLLRRDKK